MTGYKDKHNTCDPENGNYMERILPLKEYCYHMSDEEDGILRIHCGLYNTSTKNKLKKWLAKIAHYIIFNTGTWGVRISPFLIIASVRNRTEK